MSRRVAPVLLPALVLSLAAGLFGSPARGLAEQPRVAVQSAAGSWSYEPPSRSEGAKLFWTLPGEGHGDVFLACAQRGRTFYVSVAARPLPIGRRLPVTVSAGASSTIIQAVVEEGPITAVTAELPSGHPLLAILRSGEGRLRLRSPAGEVSMDIPLSGSADPVRRFEAACQPR